MSSIVISNILLVKQLQPTVTATILKNLFSIYGDVLKVKIIVPNSAPGSCHFAVIQFKLVDSAKVALKKLNGSEILEKKVTVAYCPKPIVEKLSLISEWITQKETQNSDSIPSQVQKNNVSTVVSKKPTKEQVSDESNKLLKENKVTPKNFSGKVVDINTFNKSIKNKEKTPSKEDVPKQNESPVLSKVTKEKKKKHTDCEDRTVVKLKSPEVESKKSESESILNKLKRSIQSEDVDMNDAPPSKKLSSAPLVESAKDPIIPVPTKPETYSVEVQTEKVTMIASIGTETSAQPKTFSESSQTPIPPLLVSGEMQTDISGVRPLVHQNLQTDADQRLVSLEKYIKELNNKVTLCEQMAVEMRQNINTMMEVLKQK